MLCRRVSYAGVLCSSNQEQFEPLFSYCLPEVYFSTTDVALLPHGLHQSASGEQVAIALVERSQASLEEVSPRRIVRHAGCKADGEHEGAVELARGELSEQSDDCFDRGADLGYARGRVAEDCVQVQLCRFAKDVGDPDAFVF